MEKKPIPCIRTKRTCAVILIMVMLLLSACSFTPIQITVIPSPSPTAVPTATPSPEPTPIPTPVPPSHVGGPDVIGMYINRQLLGAEYKTAWVTGKDIGIFYIYPTRREVLDPMPFKDQFLTYWNLFPNSKEYKIAYDLSFTLKSSEVVNLVIRAPKDCPKDPNAYFYPFIEVYVYDNLNRIPGPTFYHLEESSTHPETIMTSIKLTAGTRSSEVVSVKLTAYIYKEGDFDPATGHYIGQTQCEVAVQKKS